MKRHIVVAIDCDAALCNGCEMYDEGNCLAFNVMLGERYERRAVACLDAERKLMALIAAGEELEAGYARANGIGDLTDAWDAAVKEMRG